MKAERVILATVSIVGVIGAVASAIYEAPKAKKALDDYKAKKLMEESEKKYSSNNKPEEEKEEKGLAVVKEKASKSVEYGKVVIPKFWRTALCTAVAIGSEVAFFKVTAGEIAALGSAIGYLVADRKNIEKNIINVVGEDKYKEIKEKVIDDVIAEKADSGQTIEETGNGDMICIDEFSGRVFKSTEAAVQNGIKLFKDTLRDNKYACYNNLYAYWNIECTDFGEREGWASDEDYYPLPEDIHLTTEVGYSEKYGQNVVRIFFEEPNSMPDDNWMEY